MAGEWQQRPLGPTSDVRTTAIAFPGNQLPIEASHRMRRSPPELSVARTRNTSNDFVHSAPETFSEWTPTTLASVLSFSNGKSSPDRADNLPYPVYGSNGIIGFAEKTNANPHTIVIGRVGSYCGSVYFSKQKCWVTDNAIRANELDDNDAKYLFYLLQTLGLNHWRAGSGQPLLNQTILGSIPATIPDPVEQRAIAHILGTLDDKIELNQRMNETLEAMARALFKSWFVDFDPVRAKAEGRDTGLPKSLADLFPDSFEDSELGEIPEGWSARNWGEVVTLEYGKSLSDYAGNSGAYPVYGTNGKIGSHSVPLCDHSGIIIGRKGAYRGVHFCSTPFFVIDTGFYVKPKVLTELRWAYYEILRQDINSMDSGSAIPSTSRDDFYNLPVVCPPYEVQKAFVCLLNPCWSRQELGDRDSHILVALRDTLLPKLISGKLQLKDVEKIIGRVT